MTHYHYDAIPTPLSPALRNTHTHIHTETEERKIEKRRKRISSSEEVGMGGPHVDTEDLCGDPSKRSFTWVQTPATMFLPLSLLCNAMAMQMQNITN